MLALTAALVGPYFVDWTSYRADFEREASRILGRPVTVEGSATARLLPFPSVTFSDVRVAGTNASEPAMTVETFSMDAELAPFLRGEVLIFDMRLVHPKVSITIGEDGAVDWALRPSTRFDARQITLEKVTVTDGEVIVHHVAGGRTHTLSDIDADISARTLAGPWRFDGNLKFDGVATALSIGTGSVDEKGAMRLRIEARPEIYPVVIETDGDAHLEEGAAVYNGTFRLAEYHEDPARLRGSNGSLFEVSTESGTETEPGYRVTGQFSFDHKLLGIDEFRFETGPKDNPYSAEGTAFLDIGAAPRFAIKVNGQQVNFDERAQEDRPVAGQSLEARIAAFQAAFAALPKPVIPGTVDVNLPAIVAGDTTVRDVKLSAEPAKGGWDVNSLSAKLPGRTTLEGKGFAATGEEFGFKGSLVLAVGQPSGFAAWLSRDVDEAIRRLPAAGFSANVDITRRRQIFQDLELVLGDAKFRGRIDHLEPEDAKPSMLLTLRGGKMDVDGLAAFASLFVDDSGVNRFAGHDLDFEIKAGPVTAGGLTAQTVDTALRLKDGRLDIDRLSIGDLEGATVSATGMLKDFPSNPSGDLDASIIAVDLEPLVKALSGRYPENPFLAALAARAAAYPGLFQDTRIDLVANAAPDNESKKGIALSAHGETGGTEFTFTGSANGSEAALGKAALALSFNASSPDAAPLMALYGLPALPLGLTGRVETTVSAKGTVEKGLDSSISVSSEDMKARFNGRIGGEDGGLTASGKASIKAADLGPWLMTTGTALPGIAAGLPLDVTAAIDLAKGVLTLRDLDGLVVEDAVSGGLTAEMKESKPHIAGKLSLASLDLRPVAAMVLGAETLGPVLQGWPQVPFAQENSAPFTADVELAVGRLSAGSFADATDARLRAAVDSEGVRISDLSARLYGGALSGLFELKNNGGTGLLSSQVKLTGAALAEALPRSGVTGKGDVSAALTASGKSVEGMVATLSGSGTAAWHDLSIEGLDPHALPALLAKADAVGRDIDAAKVKAFAPEIVGKGLFEPADGDVPFTVAAGVVRTPSVILAGEDASLTAELRADLTEWNIGAEGELAYVAGDEALVGSEPSLRFSISGPFGSPALTFNTQPMAQFLTQRALEREQARVEAMQADLLEKQRLRREVRYYQARREERERAAEEARIRAEEEARRRAEEEARRKAEEEARLKAQEEARLKAEEEARIRAEEETRIRVEEEAKRRAEEETRQKAEAEAKRKAEEEAKRKAEEEALRKKEESPAQTNDGSIVDLGSPDETPPAGTAGQESQSQPQERTMEAPGRNPFDETSIERLLKNLDNSGQKLRLPSLQQ